MLVADCSTKRLALCAVMSASSSLRVMRVIRSIAIGILAAAVGCSSLVRYDTSASALATPNSSTQRRYMVLPGNAGVDTFNLDFGEGRAYANAVLSDHGFRLATRPESTDVVIFLSYGIGEPRITSLETTRNPYVRFGGTTTEVQTSYTRFAIMNAIDFRQFTRDQTVRELWRTTVVSTGSSGDLRRVLPVLFVAMEPYIGTRTERARRQTIREGDARVQQLRALAASASR